MHLKDYYRILELEPSATQQEVKKAYRKLAQQYHPDKNQQDPCAAAQFTEIKEAYEVLSNPGKKEYYLQQRWYNRSSGKRKEQQVITPVNILKLVLEVDKYVSTLDVFRMDKQGLFQYINTQLDDTTIEKLISFDDPEINHQIILFSLRTIKSLQAYQAETIANRLTKLAAGSPESQECISQHIRAAWKKEKQERKELVSIIIITLLICLLIWLSVK